jgi:hypothetical protein
MGFYLWLIPGWFIWCGLHLALGASFDAICDWMKHRTDRQYTPETCIGEEARAYCDSFDPYVLTLTGPLFAMYDVYESFHIKTSERRLTYVYKHSLSRDQFRESVTLDKFRYEIGRVREEMLAFAG